MTTEQFEKIQWRVSTEIKRIGSKEWERVERVDFAADKVTTWSGYTVLAEEIEDVRVGTL